MSAERYTVVGAGGFLGQHLCARLEADGHAVRRIGRGQTLPADQLGRVLWCAGVTRDFRFRPFDTARADVCDLGSVLEGSELTRLVYLSSTRLYRGAERGDPDATLHLRPNAPGDLYNAAKILGEALCAASGRPEVRIARLSTVCAARPESPDVVSELARAAIRTGAITLRSDLDSERDYLLLDDALGALLALARGGDAPIYNVAGGRNVSNRELAGRLAELTGCTVDVEPGADHIAYPPVEVSAAAADLGLRPRSLDSELPAIVAAQGESLDH